MRKVRHAVAAIHDLEPDIGKVVPLGKGGECALFLHNNQVHAVGSLCPHQNARLDGAPVEEGQIICRRHGYRFDLKSGDCRTVGGYGIPVFAAEIEGDTVFVTVWEYD